MKFSESWLREWVDPQIGPDELLEQLTMAGLEVESVEPVAAEFNGVVVARIDSVEKHPNADKLSVCVVNDGESTHQVVCGAPNVREGLVTAFARVGAVLPDNFKISKARLREVESHGMLCSSHELKMGEDHDGIIELDDALEIGADLRIALQLEDRVVDLDLTPNRGDCLSIRGLAREVGVLNNVPVNEQPLAAVEATVAAVFEVVVEDSEGCPRYLGRVIRGVDNHRPSPLWLTERLRRVGLRSIDPIVDVTNLVMIELGQPLHAFDLAQLNEPIVVRKALKGEKLTLLDGKEVNFDDGVLLMVYRAGQFVEQAHAKHFPFVIGRSNANDLAIIDKEVSRRHALIDCIGGIYVIA
ncbi:MAG: YtpR family tRNA-binding protein [Pseudomonadales bacterium]